jgi:hypothetical protein
VVGSGASSVGFRQILRQDLPILGQQLYVVFAESSYKVRLFSGHVFESACGGIA